VGVQEKGGSKKKGRDATRIKRNSVSSEKQQGNNRTGNNIRKGIQKKKTPIPGHLTIT